MATEADAYGATLLTAKEVMAVLSVGRTTLWRLEHEPTFPKPIMLGRRVKRWRASDIQDYIRSAPSWDERS